MGEELETPTGVGMKLRTGLFVSKHALGVVSGKLGINREASSILRKVAGDKYVFKLQA